MLLATKLPFGSVLLLWATLAVGQSNLGELLDAGARKLSAEEFRQELVGKTTLVSPVFQFSRLEIVYAADGNVRGVGVPAQHQPARAVAAVQGSWTTGDSDTICVSMYVESVAFPKRCQFWFKLAEDYFIADSDSDRSMRVLRRTVKR